MKRRTQAQWRALIDAHAKSGMTAAQFCRAKGLNPKYFNLRRRQLDVSAPEPSSGFAAVSVAPMPTRPRITIRDPSGATIDLPSDTAPDWLAQLLRAMRP